MDIRDYNNDLRGDRTFVRLHNAYQDYKATDEEHNIRDLFEEEAERMKITLLRSKGYIYISKEFAKNILGKLLLEGKITKFHRWRKTAPKKGEQVNHPVHYNDYDVEAIEMMRRIWGDEKVKIFCTLNAFKYRMRAGHKDNTEQDLSKERWYLDYANKLNTK